MRQEKEQLMTSTTKIKSGIYPDKFSSGIIEELRRLGRDYQLLFFFKGNCKQSRELATTVNQFCRIYGWSVWAISVGGGGLPEFPSPHHDPDLVKRMNLKFVPALLAMHCGSHFYVPISYGAATLEDIEGELEILVSHEEWRRN
jgi:conjugal transfer pilus assembly protein TraF